MWNLVAYPRVLWLIIFWLSYSASLSAQENCTVCKTLLQQVGENWYCPNCNPGQFGACALSVETASFNDYLSTLPPWLQDPFLIRLSSGEESEEDLISEVKKKVEFQQQQQDLLEKIAVLPLVEQGEDSLLARVSNLVKNINVISHGLKEREEQEKPAPKEANILNEALRAAGAVEVDPDPDPVHKQLALSNQQIFSTIMAAPLDSDSTMFHGLGLEFISSFNTQEGDIDGYAQALSTDLMEGNRIQVIIAAPAQPPVLVGTLTPHPASFDAPPDQQGGYLVLASTFFITRHQIAAAILSVLEALKKEDHQDFNAYFFRIKNPEGLLADTNHWVLRQCHTGAMVISSGFWPAVS